MISRCPDDHGIPPLCPSCEADAHLWVEPPARRAFDVYTRALHGKRGDWDALTDAERAAWEQVRAYCATYWYA